MVIYARSVLMFRKWSACRIILQLSRCFLRLSAKSAAVLWRDDTARSPPDRSFHGTADMGLRTITGVARVCHRPARETLHTPSAPISSRPSSHPQWHPLPLRPPRRPEITPNARIDKHRARAAVLRQTGAAFIAR